MPNHNFIYRMGMIIIGLLLGFIFLEISYRIWAKEYNTSNFIYHYVTGDGVLHAPDGIGIVDGHLNNLYSYHSTLGWVPTPNITAQKWNLNIKNMDDGIRSNGNKIEHTNNKVILFVGDSMTYGDEIADNETLPAHLESKLKMKVLNAAVSSYGLDQMFIRAQLLVKKYKPDILIFSFIYDDIARCGLAIRHGVSKPYYVVEDSKLVLKNTPIPTKITRVDLFRKFAGYSFVIHRIMSTFVPRYWQAGTMEDFRKVENSNPIEIAKGIFNGLDRMTRENKIQTIILLLPQDPTDNFPENNIVPHINTITNANHKITFVNPRPAITKLREGMTFDEVMSLNTDEWDHHPSSKQNEFLAGEVQKTVSSILINQ